MTDTPLQIFARRLNRLAELLPKDHECEPIFGEFDNLGEYIRKLEEENTRHGRANLVRWVLASEDEQKILEWITECINDPGFDRVPWLIAQKFIGGDDA